MGLDNPIHIAFIVIILLLVFGAKRLPELGRSLGTGMREFKDSVSPNHADSTPHQSTIAPAAQQPQAPVAQPATVQAQPAPVAQPATVQAPVAAVAEPAPVQVPVAVPPTPAQVAAAPVEQQPQHQAS